MSKKKNRSQLKKSDQIHLKIIRSFAAVILGYITFYMAVLVLWLASGYNPRHDFPDTFFLILSIVCEALFAIGSGYLIAVIAKRKELFHTGILALVFVISGIIYFCLRLNHYPIWVPLSTIFINAPGVILGGFLRLKNKQR